jgi:endonuclease/exonuclease/phosphatase family metal-dependent hydrolase
MKVIQLNIERNKHLDLVRAFLAREDADVVCLQEVMEDTAEVLAAEYGMHLSYAPHSVLRDWEEGTDGKQFGVALMTKAVQTVQGTYYYRGDGTTIPEFHRRDREDITAIRRSLARAAPVSTVSEGNKHYTIATVHFTYTPDGQPDDVQEESLERLLTLLEPYPDLLLCGDFNIPRGNKLYERLVRQFTDNIPPDIGPSLDQDLHEVKGLRYMVDYMWTRGSHHLTNVRKECGVSDHCAFVGELSLS